MNEIFKSERFGEIRTAGTVEEPLFCATDVARALKYANPAKAIIDHCKGVTILETPTNGGLQNMKFINEANLYRLILKANTDEAESFQDWVTSDVLPSIRKTGSYQSPDKPKDKVEAGLAWVEGCRKLLNLSDASTLLLMEAIARPLGLPTPDYVPSRGVHHSASELLRKHNAGISVIKFNELLRGKGFLAETTRKGKTRDHKYNFITAKGREYGENVVSPRSPNETQPHWYDERFDELLSIIK